jgi:hypothetical protein
MEYWEGGLSGCHCLWLLFQIEEGIGAFGRFVGRSEKMKKEEKKQKKKKKSYDLA